MAQSSTIKLSVCIATFNRAELIGPTLESITREATEACEIVVSDNASTDNTEHVVSDHARRFGRLRYKKQATNEGLDCNFDRSVELARGEYCWLMSDDDLLKPGAIARVLEALRSDPSLLLINIEYCNFDMSKVLQEKAFRLTADRSYGPCEMDRLFSEVGDGIWYIGGVVIKRDVWLSRERRRYYGSLFIHVAVIFQAPLPKGALVLVEPLVRYRMGNVSTYSPQTAELLLSKWPSLIESMAISEAARRRVRSAEPWANFRWLFVLRGWGHYSANEYQRWIRPRPAAIHARLGAILIALIPGVLVNAGLMLYYAARKDRGRERQWMRRSRFSIGNLIKPVRTIQKKPEHA